MKIPFGNSNTSINFVYDESTELPVIQKGTNGVTNVYAPYQDVTTFDSTIVTPIAGVDVAFVTIPAGCYALNVRAVKATVGAVVTIFAGLCYIEKNAAAAATGDWILQAQEEITFAVAPADVIHFMGSTGCTGQLLATPLG